MEKSPADVRFIRDALAELEETQRGNSWLSPYELTDVETLSEAALLLSQTSFDVILADLNQENTVGIDTLRRLRAVAQHTPVIALTPREDPGFSIRLFQEGVEDVLVKYELDCSPLGRSLRGAIERHRRSQKSRKFSIRDELSGLLNFTGFVQMGESLSALIGRTSVRASVVLFSIDNFDPLCAQIERQEEDWLLLECAELLRDSSREGDLVAYLGVGRFAWLAFERPEVSLRADLAAQEATLAAKFLSRGHAISLRYRIGMAELNATSGTSLLLALEQADQASWPIRIAPDEATPAQHAIQ
ncbi:MAG: hypothetical protein OHK0021_15250 [Bryobacter sp.]